MQEKAQKTQQLLPQDTEKKEQFVQFTTLEVHFVMSGESFNFKRFIIKVDNPIAGDIF